LNCDDEIFLLCSAEQRPGFRKAFLAEKNEIPTIGFLSTRARDESSDVTAAFIRGLEAGGFVTGRNLRIEYRWAEFKYERLPSLAADLIGRQVSVIAAVGGAHSGACVENSDVRCSDRLCQCGRSHRVRPCQQPQQAERQCDRHSMITVTLAPKRLQLLHELVPAPAGIAMLANSSSPYFEQEKMDVMASARALGRKLEVFTASNVMEIETAFSSLRERTGALLVSADPYFDGERDRLVSLAARYSVPTVYQWREFATIGGLMSYGTSIHDAYQQAETYVAKILNGDKPADLPVLQPTRIELVINLKTAATLGLTVPAPCSRGGRDRRIVDGQAQAAAVRWTIRRIRRCSA